MADDLTPGEGNPVKRSRRLGMAEGVAVPFAGICVLFIAFAVFLFERIEAKTSETLMAVKEAASIAAARSLAIETSMSSARNERNAQVSAIQQDVVRLQDGQANTSIVMSEIKADVREILAKLDHLERRP